MWHLFMAQSCRVWHNGAMMRHALMPCLLALVVLAGGRAGLARAQSAKAQPAGAEEASATSQTDRSEEAWRKSRRKQSARDPFSRAPNASSTGVGAPLPPLSAMERLPEESQRYLKRQRARVIASMTFGKDGKPELGKAAQYQPSEAAKKDPQLARDEEEAWQVILTDLQGGGSRGNHDAQGGPHKVAVAGRGGDRSTPVLRGGSAQSAAEILARLKGLKAGASAGAASASGQSPGQSPGKSQRAQTNTKDQSGVDQSAARSAAEQSASARQQPSSPLRGGSAQSARDILSAMKGGQPGGQGQQGGQSGQSGKGQQGSQAGASGPNGAEAAQRARAAADPLDPLTLPEAEAADAQAACSASSAYAYLKKNTKSEARPAGCD